jgi:uncharacterized membrane protein (UPF0127 family)
VKKGQIWLDGDMLMIATLFLLLGNHPVKIEEATTLEQKRWGLMGRTSLSENEGMLFTIDPPSIEKVWMFNCFVDLDVAFLDQDMTIVEIHTMKAYPEKMDPSRPVFSPTDFRLYLPNDPIYQFFDQESISSSFKASYTLEMPSQWFKNNNVQIGETLRE